MIIRFGLDEKRETLLLNSAGEVFRLRKGEETFTVKNTEVWDNTREWALENADAYLDNIPYEITEDLKSVFYILLENGLLESVHSLMEGSKKSLALFTFEDGELVPFYISYDSMKYKGVVADNFSDLGTEPSLWFKNSDGVVVPCKNMITDIMSEEKLTIISDCVTSFADVIVVDDIEAEISKSSVAISLNSVEDNASARPTCADCTNKACCNEICPIEDFSSKACFKKVASFSVTEPTVTELATTEPATTEPTVTEPTVTELATTEPATTEPTVTEPTVTEPVVVADTKTKFCLTRNNACSIQ